MQPSPEERQRIEAEEKLKAEGRNHLQSEAEWKRLRQGFLVALFLLLILLIAVALIYFYWPRPHALEVGRKRLQAHGCA